MKRMNAGVVHVEDHLPQGGGRLAEVLLVELLLLVALEQVDAELVAPLGPHLVGLVQLVDEVVHAEQELDAVQQLGSLEQHLRGGPLARVVVPLVLVAPRYVSSHSRRKRASRCATITCVPMNWLSSQPMAISKRRNGSSERTMYESLSRKMPPYFMRMRMRVMSPECQTR
ncbi:LOW QUALITY PROTEIN: hypothetical protein KUF71_009126 [Frankliniella fusca]|uniref:Secreted protein n=1 Tax=Frankliniella fusca TaxID=407009 RepID=A0AAE1HEG4_9NEOP|nr:LOW QUALITY PROTEIN: hypothetical protein KUF71_009126 [Frankliniella fusca]